MERFCYGCKQKFDNSQLKYCEKDGHFYCKKCIPDFLSQTLHFEKQGKPIKKDYPWYGFGIELEFDGEFIKYSDVNELLTPLQKQNGKDIFFITQDLSLNNGFELVSNPFTIETFFNNKWDEILQGIVKAGGENLNPYAGMHIHVSRTMFGETEYEQCNNIAKVVLFYNYYYKEFLKVSERKIITKYFCKNQSYIDIFENNTFLSSNEEIQKLIYDIKNKKSTHYECVSFTPKETIEFRMMGSTLDYNAFKNKILLHLLICSNACNIKWEDVLNKEKWFTNMDNNLKKFLQDKRSFC